MATPPKKAAPPFAKAKGKAKGKAKQNAAGGNPFAKKAAAAKKAVTKKAK